MARKEIYVSVGGRIAACWVSDALAGCSREIANLTLKNGYGEQ